MTELAKKMVAMEFFPKWSLPVFVLLIYGLHPFSETNFQDFFRTQIDFSRVSIPPARNKNKHDYVH